MKRMIIVPVLAVCISALVTLYAAQAVVVFFVGKVYVVDVKGKKTPLTINMVIPDNATIVTGKNSYVVIQNGDKKYSIKENASVKGSDLVKYKPGADDTYAVIRKLYEKIRTEKTTVTAVRADKKITDVQPVFTEGDDEPAVKPDDESRIYSSISELVSAQDYSGALVFYAKHKDKIKTGSARTEYLVALSNFYLGKYAESADLFTKLYSIKKDERFASSAVFYAAFSYQNLLEFKRSNELFSEYLTMEPRGDLAPYACYLKGVNFLRLQDGKNAEEQFRTVVDKFPSDPIAADAKLMINNK